MNVEKLKPIEIESPIKKYYFLKNKKSKLCPICKKNQLIFTEKNRFLMITCNTPNCKSNVKIPTDTYYTHDTLYETNYQNYTDSVHKVIQKKYDILFKYTSDKDILELRTDYLQYKKNYDEINQNYYEKDNLKMEKLKKLYMERDELISKKIKADELNHILNNIHTHEYKKIGNTYELYTPFCELTQII